jgi:predicted transposase YdaD
MDWDGRVSPRGSLQQPLQSLVDGVIWLSLEELGQQAELKRSTQTILDRWPELLSAVLTMLFERLPTLSTEELMVFSGIPTQELRHSKAAQQLIEEGRQEGEAQGEAKVTLRLLNRI